MHSVGTLILTFLRDKRGSSITLFAAGIGLILGMAGLAVDLGFLYSVQNQLQVTADTAALAATDRLPDVDDARTQATAFVEANMPSSKHGTVLATADFKTGNWDDSTSTFTDVGTPLNAVQVTVRRATSRHSVARN